MSNTIDMPKEIAEKVRTVITVLTRPEGGIGGNPREGLDTLTSDLNNMVEDKLVLSTGFSAIALVTILKMIGGNLK